MFSPDHFLQNEIVFFSVERRRPQVAHFTHTFGMNDYFCVGKLRFHFQQTVASEFDVRVTISLPQCHRPGLFHDPLAEILVRHEQNVFVLRRGPNNFLRVAAGANFVAR